MWQHVGTYVKCFCNYNLCLIKMLLISVNFLAFNCDTTQRRATVCVCVRIRLSQLDLNNVVSGVGNSYKVALFIDIDLIYN